MIFSGKKSGFTLIETVITMAILAMVLGIVLSFQGSRRDQFNLMIYQEKMRALITRTKSLALNNTMPNACGYGVHVDSNQAFIFIIKKSVGIECRPPYYYQQSNSNKLASSLDSLDAKEGISFKDASLVSLVDQPIDIAFEPPDPVVYLYKNRQPQIPSGSSASSVAIGIVVGKNYRKVVVNSVGQISVVNK